MADKKNWIKIGSVVGTVLTILGGVVAGSSELASTLKKEENNK